MGVLTEMKQKAKEARDQAKISAGLGDKALAKEIRQKAKAIEEERKALLDRLKQDDEQLLNLLGV